MTEIKKDEYIFSVDTEKTKEYYKTHSLCECGYCRNFYPQIAEKLPKLAEFLSEFGVDASKPDEIMSVEQGSDINYISVDYTVCGSIKSMGEYEIDIYDNSFLSIAVTDGFASPNEQTGEYFTLSVNNIILPWVLDEPLSEDLPFLLKEKSKGLFKRLFGKFIKK